MSRFKMSGMCPVRTPVHPYPPPRGSILHLFAYFVAHRSSKLLIIKRLRKTAHKNGAENSRKMYHFRRKNGPKTSLWGRFCADFANSLTCFYAAVFFSAASAVLACSTSLVKPAASFTAISARILRSSSIPAFFNPLMSCE